MAWCRATLNFLWMVLWLLGRPSATRPSVTAAAAQHPHDWSCLIKMRCRHFSSVLGAFTARWQLLQQLISQLLQAAAPCWNKSNPPYTFHKLKVVSQQKSACRQGLPPRCARSYLVYVLSLLLHGFQDVLRRVTHVDDCLYALPLTSREDLL